MKWKLTLIFKGKFSYGMKIKIKIFNDIKVCAGVLWYFNIQK